MNSETLKPFDAVLMMSFGGPDQEEDVLPFLQNVTAGRGIPDERLVEVGEHYYRFGGKSPINEQNKALVAALEGELARRGITTPVVWGNRNWKPFLADAVRDANAEGASRFLAVSTSAYSSYSSCRQYREDYGQVIEDFAAEGTTIAIEKIRQYFNHPGFVDAQTECLISGVEALKKLLSTRSDPATPTILFVTHSVPEGMQQASAATTLGYQGQHIALMNELTRRLRDAGIDWPAELVYCSRSGAPGTPWLEPDINDRMEEIAAVGTPAFLAVPIGFVSDHMEVKFDLDTEAASTAQRLNAPYVRSASVGTHPRFVAGLVDLLEERAAQVRGEDVDAPAETEEKPLVPGSGACSAGCCAAPRQRVSAPSWD